MPIYGFRCGGCGKTEEHYFSLRDAHPTVVCSCGQVSERDLMAEARNHIPGSAWPMTTKNINGKEMTFQNEAELQRACKEFGVTHRPDSAFLEKRYEGLDFRTGQQRYSEGSGRGLPGSWV